MVTVTVAVPAPTAVTVPAETCTTLVLFELQVIVLLLAVVGLIVAVKRWVWPIAMFRAVVDRVTPVTGTPAAPTVTVAKAVFEPSTLIAMMLVVPVPVGVTSPLLTVATLVLPEIQVTDWLVASKGVKMTERVWGDPPAVKVRLDGDRAMLVTAL